MLKLRPGYVNRSFSDVIKDMVVRFILNCPKEDLATSERLFFQLEEAHWFYEDFAREENPGLPKRSFAGFVKDVFAIVPILSVWCKNPSGSLRIFRTYKSRIPVRGAIILTKDMEWALLVRGWESKAWGFPKGKINKDEPDVDCAIREVKEEVGFDITPYVVDTDWIEVTAYGRTIRLYVARGVPKDTVFKTETRKEISEIKWHEVSKLPSSGRCKGSDEQSKQNAMTMRNVSVFVSGLHKYIDAHSRGASTGPIIQTDEHEHEIEHEHEHEHEHEQEHDSSMNESFPAPMGYDLSQNKMVPPVQYFPKAGMPFYDQSLGYYGGMPMQNGFFPQQAWENSQQQQPQPQSQQPQQQVPLLPSQALLAELMNKTTTGSVDFSLPPSSGRSNSSVLLDHLRKPPTPEIDSAQKGNEKGTTINRLLYILNHKELPSAKPASKKNTLLGLLDDEPASKVEEPRNDKLETQIAPVPKPKSKKNALADLLFDQVDKPSASEREAETLTDDLDRNGSGKPAAENSRSDKVAAQPKARNSLKDLLFDEAAKAETTAKTETKVAAEPKARNSLKNLLFDEAVKPENTAKSETEAAAEPKARNSLKNLLFDEAAKAETTAKAETEVAAEPKARNSLKNLLFDEAAKSETVAKSETATKPNNAAKTEKSNPKPNGLMDLLFADAPKSAALKLTSKSATKAALESVSKTSASETGTDLPIENPVAATVASEPVAVSDAKPNDLMSLLSMPSAPVKDNTSVSTSTPPPEQAPQPHKPNLADLLFEAATEEQKSKSRNTTPVPAKKNNSLMDLLFASSSASLESNAVPMPAASVVPQQEEVVATLRKDLKDLLFETALAEQTNEPPKQAGSQLQSKSEAVQLQKVQETPAPNKSNVDAKPNDLMNLLFGTEAPTQPEQSDSKQAKPEQTEPQQPLTKKTEPKKTEAKKAQPKQVSAKKAQREQVLLNQTQTEFEQANAAVATTTTTTKTKENYRLRQPDPATVTSDMAEFLDERSRNFKTDEVRNFVRANDGDEDEVYTPKTKSVSTTKPKNIERPKPSTLKRAERTKPRRTSSELELAKLIGLSLSDDGSDNEEALNLPNSSTKVESANALVENPGPAQLESQPKGVQQRRAVDIFQDILGN